jgi:DNA polymerase-1
MRFVYWDTETHLIKKGNITPRLVCVSWAERFHPARMKEPLSQADTVSIFSHAETFDEITRGLLLREDGIAFIRAHLEDDDIALVGHNTAYDFGVVIASAHPAESGRLMRLVFEKYEKGLVHDTDTRQKLIDIATGEMKFHNDEDTGEPIKTRYDLAELARRLLKKFLKKKDTWRLRYAELDGVPLAEWPEDAVRYAIDDAVTTLEVHEKQDEIAGGPIPDSDRQHRAAWGLHLMSAWGIRTDGVMVAKLKAELAAEFAGMMNKLRPSGLLKIAPSRVPKRGKLKGTTVPEKISKFMKAIQERVVSAYESAGEKVVMTEPSDKFPYGQVSTAKKTLLEAGGYLVTKGKETGDATHIQKGEELITLAESGKIGKLLQTYIPVLESGITRPINARYNGLVETGRTSCASPNMQNHPRG